ncbi:ROK family protein [Variovorax sp. ZS18.2.2]|uniref:ROK family transcriptional regulator n=1 Tax=Variovorax sp. ZS18.2.2 TaxID=2971255 RepID=UPI00215108AD|nr:ROK family protein [Variovorax sp. ZS18.2.2]MCR6477821.1 ROK family protein [Variovorax sp. ZS18.2.2]
MGLTSGAGILLSLIASGQAQSRSALIEVSGLSRSTVTERLATLFEAGFILEGEQSKPSGGRPTNMLQINQSFGVVLVSDVGETHVHSAVTDLEPGLLVETTDPIDIGDGPQAILAVIARQYWKLLKRLKRAKEDVLGICLGLPAPVDHLTGRVFGPSVLAGWDDFAVGAFLAAEFDAPTLIENDVNLMTLSEARRFWPDVDQLLFIKAGTGIGSGIVTDRRLYRGAQGVAGDIGHIQFSTTNAPLCRCGKLGCVEARAGGWAIARDLRARGFEAKDARDVVDLVRKNRPEAINLVREAGRVLGEVAADVVSLLNPSVIVIGGTLIAVEEYLLAGVRELVYQRCLPLATRTLQIAPARSDLRTGLLLGAAQLVIEARMQPAAIEQTLERHRKGAAATRPQRARQ